MPPNLLVGPGATEYAYDKGVTVLPNDFLVSNSSRERWLRWKQDLQAANEKQIRDLESGQLRYADYDAITHTGGTPAAFSPPQFSPPQSPSAIAHAAPLLAQTATPTRTLAASTADLLPTPNYDARSDLYFNGSEGVRPAPPAPSRASSTNGVRQTTYFTDAGIKIDDGTQWTAKRQRVDGAVDGVTSHSAKPRGLDRRLDSSISDERDATHTLMPDHITDTVGAIAVDCFGNIAAGSSSGGIGMKHRGRTGPAALVGIGTAVMPVNPLDRDRVSVATVTSGTGEHMATTMAAATCADRIYSAVRKIPGGGLVNCTEEEAMKGMIKEEFMNHPGVKSSHCAGAIGIMAVKKTKDGIFLYFGHNTDSFAIASMHSEEKKPVCTMSRNTGNAAVAQGGRSAKYRRLTQ